MCKEIPVYGSGPARQKMEKDEAQRSNYKQGRNKRDGGSEAAFDLAPLVVVVSSHNHWTALLLAPPPRVLRSSCATRLARIVIPKRTSAISKSDCKCMSVVASVNS